MKSNLTKILKKPFIQSVIVMASGTAAAQIVKMILTPIITRVYGPEAFGIMGVFMSVIQIIIPIAALTYPMAIVLPKHDRDAKGLICLSLYLSSAIALITTIILLVFNRSIIKVFNIEEISSFLYLIPVVIIFSTLMQVSEQWFIRTKQFSINAKVTFYQALIIEMSKLGIGFINPVASVLVVLTALSNGLKALLLFIFGRKSKSSKLPKWEAREISLKKLAKKHSDFPLLRAPMVFIDAITKGLPVLLLTGLFSPISAGFYTLCRTALTIPSSFLGKAVGDVFYPRINGAALNKEKVSMLIMKSVYALGGLGIFPFGIIILFGPHLFGFVFGADWITAGDYARWLALSSFFRFVNEPCIRALPVFSAQSLHLIVTIIQTVVRLLALWLGFFIFNDDKVAVALYGLSGAIINFGLILITLSISKKFERAYKG